MRIQGIIPVSIHQDRVYVGRDPHPYEYIEGRPIGITWERLESRRGEKYWYFDLMGDGEIYRLRFPWESHLFKSLVLCLAGDRMLSKTLSYIRITPYLNEGKVRLFITDRGVPLRWVTRNLPPAKVTIQDGIKVYDTEERMNFIVTFVERINNNLK